MYSQNRSQPISTLTSQTALTDFYNGQYFGTTIQLSDLLQVVHNVRGWTMYAGPRRF
jgi:hypothetical protein